MIIETPLVSVILPTYNRADILRTSIDSVLGQSYSNLELIVVDDGSTDNTESIITAYRNEKIKYIKQENKGVSSARNLGIRASGGYYIAFIDSDDVWHSDKLQRQIDFFNVHHEDNIAMVSTDVVVVEEDGSIKNRRRLVKVNSSCVLSLIDVFKDPYLGLPTVMLKRECVNINHLFDENLKTAEDIDLYLNLSINYNIGYMHEKLVEVHKTAGSLSEGIDSYSDNVFVVKRFVENNKDIFNKYQKIIASVLHSIIYDYAKTLLWNGNKKECRKQIISSFNYKITAASLLLYLKSFLTFN